MSSFHLSGLKAVTLSLQQVPQAVLPMRLNGDALKDLVIINQLEGNLSTILTQAVATYTVNNAGSHYTADSG